MPRKIALKRLSSSDLTLFKAYYEQNPSSKQKAINLNSDVLIDYFYPGLPAEVPVQLHINGPGITRTDSMRRAIVRSPGSKNRRLNGELVHNPTGSQPDRYTRLQPGDIALLEFFDGPSGYPQRISMALIGAAAPDDAAALASLNTYFATSNRTMLPIGETKLAALLEGKISATHPLQAFLSDAAELELLAEGGDVELDEPEPEPVPVPLATGSPAVARRTRAYKPKDFNKTAKPSLRRVTPEAMAKSKAAATENGESGEQLVNLHLADTMAPGEFEWSSRKNAAGPYDFMLNPATGQTMVDVKSTTGGFETPFHISLNEIKQAASAPDKYLIYRVYDVNGTPKLRISGNIRDFAAGMMTHIKSLPAGIIADGFKMSPAMLAADLNFGPEIDLSPDEDDF